MGVRLGQHRQPACAALALLALPLLCGCATLTLDSGSWRFQSVRGVRGAYRDNRQLWIRYTRSGYWPEDKVVSFNFEDLRSPLPHHGGRVDSPSAIPQGAEPVRVIRLKSDESPSLPPGVPIAVVWRARRREAQVVIRDEDEVPVDRSVSLPCDDYQAWWYYPLLPLALTVDIVTFPIQYVLIWRDFRMGD